MEIEDKFLVMEKRCGRGNEKERKRQPKNRRSSEPKNGLQAELPHLAEETHICERRADVGHRTVGHKDLRRPPGGAPLNRPVSRTIVNRGSRVSVVGRRKIFGKFQNGKNVYFS